MAYPHPTADTLADGTIHVLGLGFAIPATILLTTYAASQGEQLTPTLVYAACFVLSLLASAIYHLLPFDRTRALLGRIDHAAIYFKIAGTYTPFVVLIGTGFAYGILAVVWALAIIGAVAKLSFWSTESKASLYLYLGMGWLSVLLVWPMWQNLPTTALTLPSSTRSPIVWRRTPTTRSKLCWLCMWIPRPRWSMTSPVCARRLMRRITPRC